MKILLLEDDVILQEIIEEFLLESGYEVEAFFDVKKHWMPSVQMPMICYYWM